MSTPVLPAMKSPSAPPRRTDASYVPAVDASDGVWKPLYLIGGAAALLAVVIVALAVVVFLFWPPPTGVERWFALFHRNGFLGLLDLDLLLVASYVVLIPFHIALYVALRRVSQSFMAIALAFNLVGVALILAVNPGIAMLNLSNTYITAASEAQRAAALAAGQALMANWSGTSFVLGYLLGGFAMMITGVVMLRSKNFSKLIAYLALVGGALMLVPASAGIVGLIISLVSLAPTEVFLVLVARRLYQMGDVPLLGGSSYVMAHPR